ncbi:hypothetical protein ACH5RR_036442 [Cinchona calisaya]|uniref:Uncharacterized protein n=1 Tax=Cinchona calisaya TaxID=153742 RepID=A0ABD2Y8N7_9GENT
MRQCVLYPEVEHGDVVIAECLAFADTEVNTEVIRYGFEVMEAYALFMVFLASHLSAWSYVGPRDAKAEDGNLEIAKCLTFVDIEVNKEVMRCRFEVMAAYAFSMVLLAFTFVGMVICYFVAKS